MIILLYIWFFGFGLAVIKGEINAMKNNRLLPLAAIILLTVLWPFVLFIPSNKKK